MTIAAALALAASAVAVFGPLLAWVATRTVFARLDSLETSRTSMGERFGEGQRELRDQLGEVRRWQAYRDGYEAGRKDWTP